LKKIKNINSMTWFKSGEELSSFAIDLKNVFGTLVENIDFYDGCVAGS